MGVNYLFVILTDGLTEVFDARDQQFGIERVKAVVQSVASEPLAVIEQRLLGEIRSHGAQFDDQTLLLVRAVG